MHTILKQMRKSLKTADKVRGYPITFADGKIIFKSLKDPFAVHCFVSSIEAAKKLNSCIEIDLSPLEEGLFPNACVPVSAIFEQYKALGLSFKILGDEDTMIERTGIFSPKQISSDHGTVQNRDILSSVWKFQSAKDVYELVESFVWAISKCIECSDGVLSALDWCLNEVMDNVLQHSQAKEGYIMAQYHPHSKKVAVCIADSGIGIFGTLLNSKYHPKSAIDAITLAVKEGVTRDPNIGQGNGLWGLLQVVQQNKGGMLTIRSGKGGVAYINDSPRTYDNLKYISHKNQSTFIDFQLDANYSIDVSKALHSPYVGNLTFEKTEVNLDVRKIAIKDCAQGYGTRRSGEQVRNMLLNLLRESTGRVLIDFSEVAIISSSFADECLAKLMLSIGFIDFHKRVELINPNPINQGIINKAIIQRLGQAYIDNQTQKE